MTSHGQQFLLDPRTEAVRHHLTLYDCKDIVPDQPLNEPFDCLELTNGCVAITAYSRNFTSPPPWLMAKANAAWPFGAGISKYWVSNPLLPQP